MVNQVFQFIQQEGMFDRGDRVLVGVSGGADSVCLLLVLAFLRHRCSISLAVAHYDHAMRKESFKEVLFVKKLAVSLGIPFFTDRRKGKKPQSSKEDSLRNLRYDFFYRVAQEYQADVLALAHTQTDQAETTLMRILRGAGLDGLRSILSVRYHQDLKIVRPLLEVSRLSVEQYLQERKQCFLTDTSNDENVFLRNIIRNKIFPFIKKETKYDLAPALLRVTDIAKDDYDFLLKEVQLRYQKRISKKSLNCLSTIHWGKEHPSMRKMMIKTFLKDEGVSAVHIKEIDELILTKKSFQYQVSKQLKVLVIKEVMKKKVI